MLPPTTPSRKTLAATVTVTTEDALGITTTKNSLMKVIVNDGVTIKTRTRKVSDVTKTELSTQGVLLLLADILTKGR